jgi:hypothetical protein
MPKRSNEFQKLVTLINGCLHDSGKVVESALLVDKTNGAKREVDILISSEIADYSVNISVEVRDRARKADITWVEEMHAKHEHLPTDKLVLVSRRGFTKPALGKADFYGIEAITFEETLETDWELATRMTSTGVFTVTTINYKCSAVCDHLDGKKVFSPARRSTKVFLPYRETPTDFDQMVQYFLFEPQIKNILYKQLENTSERTFWFDYTPQPGTYVLDSDQTKMALLKFRFEIKVEHTDTPIKFASGRYGKREVVIGASSDSDTQLYYAMVRKEGDRVEGLLCDKAGLRKLISEP